MIELEHPDGAIAMRVQRILKTAMPLFLRDRQLPLMALLSVEILASEVKIRLTDATPTTVPDDARKWKHTRKQLIDTARSAADSLPVIVLFSFLCKKHGMHHESLVCGWASREARAPTPDQVLP